MLDNPEVRWLAERLAHLKAQFATGARWNGGKPLTYPQWLRLSVCILAEHTEPSERKERR